MKKICLLLYLTTNIYSLALTQKPLVVLIPSYNNQAFCRYNLDSVYKQTYENFRIIYINDCSTDDTNTFVTEFISTQSRDISVTMINNTTRLGSCENIYRGVHLCEDHEIVVLLDGDDIFINNEALSIISHAYDDDNILMTYGQFVYIHAKSRGSCAPFPPEIIAQNNYRSYEWISSHPKSFYAGLFKLIQKEDLMHNGHFFPVTGDLAYMFALLELSGGRHLCIPDLLYGYNDINPLNDFRTSNHILYYELIIRLGRRYTAIPKEMKFGLSNQ